MSSNYKLSLIIYCGFLIFASFFMIMLWGASGHQGSFNFEHYLILFYVIASTLILIILVKIPHSSKKIKLLFDVLAVISLIVNLFSALQYFVEIILGNLSFGFVVFSTALIGAFVMSIISLILEIVRKRNGISD